jgi:hypothetical protein
MATTTNGLPYPVGTDKVVDGDDAIRSLAESVDTSLLPHGYARARCTTALSAGGGAWNLCWLDVMADQKGQQTSWTLEAASRRIKILKAGVFLLQAALTLNGVHAVGIATSMDAAAWDRIASVPVGTVNYTNSVSVIRYLPANMYVALMFYCPTTQNTVADTTNSPSYLAIQALGGTA